MIRWIWRHIARTASRHCPCNLLTMPFRVEQEGFSHDSIWYDWKFTILKANFAQVWCDFSMKYNCLKLMTGTFSQFWESYSSPCLSQGFAKTLYDFYFQIVFWQNVFIVRSMLRCHSLSFLVLCLWRVLHEMCYTCLILKKISALTCYWHAVREHFSISSSGKFPFDDKCWPVHCCLRSAPTLPRIASLVKCYHATSTMSSSNIPSKLLQIATFLPKVPSNTAVTSTVFWRKTRFEKSLSQVY